MDPQNHIKTILINIIVFLFYLTYSRTTSGIAVRPQSYCKAMLRYIVGEAYKYKSSVILYLSKVFHPFYIVAFLFQLCHKNNFLQTIKNSS